jgi:hypothetical protein
VRRPAQELLLYRDDGRRTMLDGHYRLIELLGVAAGLLGMVLALDEPKRSRAGAWAWMLTFVILIELCLYGVGRLERRGQTTLVTTASTAAVRAPGP